MALHPSKLRLLEGNVEILRVKYSILAHQDQTCLGLHTERTDELIRLGLHIQWRCSKMKLYHTSPGKYLL